MQTDNQNEWLTAVPGRFQPLTLGHIKVCHNAYKKTGQKVVMLMIYSRPTSRTPFDAEVMSKIYDAGLKSEPWYAGIRVIPNAYFLDYITDGIIEGAGQIKTIACGADREKSYKAMQKSMAKSGYAVDIIVNDRPAGAVSATQVRETVRTGDDSAYKKLVPAFMLSKFGLIKTMLEKQDAEDKHSRQIKENNMLKTIKDVITESEHSPVIRADVSRIVEFLIFEKDAYIHVETVHGKLTAQYVAQGKTGLVNGDQNRIAYNSVQCDIYGTDDTDDQLLKDTVNDDLDMSWDDVEDEFDSVMVLVKKDKTTEYFIGNF
jgi:phosphopantetheine adenylyltransferase